MATPAQKHHDTVDRRRATAGLARAGLALALLLAGPLRAQQNGLPAAGKTAPKTTGGSLVNHPLTLTKCGLGYATASAKLTQRSAAFPLPSVTQPAALTISGIPTGATIEKAFLWWVIEGTTSGPSSAIFQGSPVAGTLVGSDPAGKCWSLAGTSGWRADVTGLVAPPGNGTYTVAGLPVSALHAGAVDTDGVTLFIAYSLPGTGSKGSLVVNDGLLVNDTGTTPSVSSVSGFSGCPDPNARSFVLVSDFQHPSASTSGVFWNGGPLTPFAENFWNWVEQTTPPTAGQTTMTTQVLGVNDCVAWQVQGLSFSCPAAECQPGNGNDDGDPHLTTVSGAHYDFQSAGEFVSLRGGNGLQIQTRQTPASTTSCVSINTAVAARVGKRRVTYEPSLGGAAAPNGYQLRVDGVLTALGANGINLGNGGRVANAPLGNGIEIDFPDGTALLVTANYWTSQGKWYLNVDAFGTPAREGILGASAPGSWLPALPNGASLGPLPASPHQRYVDLHQTFANAWRVSAATSLFDYAPGTSTATFTLPSWPQENPPCTIPKVPPAKPLDPRTAETLCRPIVDKGMHANCVFDVTVAGEPSFARAYLLTQRFQAGATTTTVRDDKDPTPVGGAVTFTATVARKAAGGKGVPTGTVQLVLDGSPAGAPVKLDANGRATWTTSSLKAGSHQAVARYVPTRGSAFLASVSLAEPHTVTELAPPPVTISNLPMQGGNETTPCPALGVLYRRSDAASVPYLGILLSNLDQQCGSRGPGLRVSTVKFLRCAPDPRGKGFGPNASADVTCGK